MQESMIVQPAGEIVQSSLGVGIVAGMGQL